MCYRKPGPRCAASAERNLKDALSTGDALRIAKARQDYMLTPAGIQELRDKGRHETAEVMEAKRNELIELSQATVKNDKASRKLSQLINLTYYEPTDFDKHNISGYWDLDRDREEAIDADISNGINYHLYNTDGFYTVSDLAEDRMTNMDYEDDHLSRKMEAEELIKQGKFTEANLVFSEWTGTKNRAISRPLSKEANASYEETLRVLEEWDTGQRARIYEAAHKAFGGPETYNQNDPTHRVLSAQYFRTQEYLQEQGMDTLRVYRSAGDADTGAIASCTVQAEVAQAQGMGIHYADVPAENVISLPQTGMGSVPEREIVINPHGIEWYSPERLKSVTSDSSGYHQDC